MTAAGAFDSSFAASFGGGAPWFDMPPAGSFVADLATLKQLIGALTSTDDANLERALLTAREWIYERCMSCEWGHVDVQYAILLLASRLYKRRQSPEGVAGFAGDGVVVRVLASDPDIRALIERHLEMRNVGIG